MVSHIVSMFELERISYPNCKLCCYIVSTQITVPTDTLPAEPVIIKFQTGSNHMLGGGLADSTHDSAYLLVKQYACAIEGVMVIHSTERSESSGSQKAPGWIKNSAGWWATDQIEDITYISGIQYLVSVGIIQVG